MINEAKHTDNSMNLYEWLQIHYSEDEMRSIFLNMDRALKYIHDHDYCIGSFSPIDIHVLNNEDDYIQFEKLVKLSDDSEIKREMIREDIFNSAFIQIGFYSKTLQYLKPDYLKEEFDAFAQFIPSDDVPYYRGVIQRGASVYYCEYTAERQKRDLVELEKQLGDESSVPDREISNAEMTNKKINDVIYRRISGMREAAFVNLLIIPTIIIAIVVIVTIIGLILGLFA